MIDRKPKNMALMILVIVIVTVVTFAIRNYFPYPENEFNITGKEPMCLSHLYNVNGTVGAEKRDFTAGEHREIMDFISQLEYKEPMPIQTETIYGVPAQLTVENLDGTKTIFSFNTDIGVKKYGKEGNVLSQGIYIISEKQRINVLGIVGVVED